MAERRYEIVGRPGQYALVRVRKPDFLPRSLVRKLERMIDREIAATTRQLLAKR
jgi:hypothetical protein